ncbi:MAG: hypothetical protein HY320_00960 [Armatimonadetes bacterium]|nr:hypothetical protein [Armatimonadota bacterium]
MADTSIASHRASNRRLGTEAPLHTPKMTHAEDALRQQHDILVEMLARRIKIPQWTVAVNTSAARDHLVPCPALPAGAFYPDLVMTERFTGRIAAVGEVETEATLAGEEPEARWWVAAYLTPKFFVYVPEACEKEVKERLRRARVRPAGLFLYFFSARNALLVRRAGG